MKKIALLSVFVLSVVLAGCSDPAPAEINPLKGYETHVVQEGNVQTSKYWIGTVKPVQEIVLTPEVGGKITRFFVDIGDDVKQGEMLLKIDSDESATQGAAASSMAQALESVKESTARLFDEQIEAMQHQLEAMKKQVEIAKLTYTGKDTGKEDTLRVLEQEKRTAEKTLEELKDMYATREKTLLENTENAFNQAYILTNEIIDFADQILGVTEHNQYTNDLFENSLSARNTQLKNEAEESLRKLIQRKQELEKRFDALQDIFTNIDLIQGTGKDEIIALLDTSIDYMQDLDVFLKLIRKVFDHTVVGRTISQDMLQGWIETLLGFQEKREQALLTANGENLLGLKGVKQMIENIQSQYNLEYTQAYEQIKTLEKQIQATKNGKNTEIALADKQTDLAHENYRALQQQIEALKQEKSAKLAEIQSQIVMTRGQANQARVMAGNATMKAPFDGVVMERYVDEGAVVGPGVPLLKLGDTSEKIIEVRLPQQYRDLVQEGDEVSVEVKKTKKLITAKIKKIAPSADDMTKTILVKATLAYKPLPSAHLQTIPSSSSLGEGDKEEGGKGNDGNFLSLGSLVKVYFDLKKNRDDGTTSPAKQVVLPLSFIRYEYGEAYVWVWNDEKQKAEKRAIEIGECSEQSCEVVSGLRSGEIVVRL